MKHKMTIKALALGLLGISAVCTEAATAGNSTPVTTLRVPEGVGMTAIARQTTVRPGALIAVDVYLSDVDDLGAYQIRLTTYGAVQGNVAIERVEIDRARVDYVFATQQTIDMLDHKPRSARIGVVSAAGGAAVNTGPMYAGTFYYRVSQNAKGTCLVNIETGPTASIMTTSHGTVIPFAVGEPAAISIIKPTRRAHRSD